MRKAIAALLTALLLLPTAALAVNTGQTDKITFKAAQGGAQDEIVLTVSVKDLVFNVIQFAVKYDAEKLTPRNASTGADASSTAQMTDYLGNLYSRGSGWMAVTPRALDAEGGVAEYTVSTDISSRGREGGSDANGYKHAGSGLDLMTLHFTLKDTAVFTADSIQFTPTPSNPDGILCTLEEGQTAVAVSGQTLAVRDFTDLGIPLAETAYVPPDTPQPPGGSGGGGGSVAPPEQEPQPPVEQIPTDVNGHWAQQQLLRLKDSGLLSGYPDGTIRPDGTLKRGEMCAILCKLLGLTPVTDQIAFGDLNNHWAASYVTAVYKAGLMSGTEKGAEPDRDITRQEMLVILDHIVKPPEAERTVFPDIAQAEPWAAGAVARLAAVGFIAGDENGNLKPRDTLTRAAMAILICKTLDYQK